MTAIHELRRLFPNRRWWWNAQARVWETRGWFVVHWRDQFWRSDTGQPLLEMRYTLPGLRGRPALDPAAQTVTVATNTNDLQRTVTAWARRDRMAAVPGPNLKHFR